MTVFGPLTAEVSFAQQQRVAGQLRSMGLGRGDRVAFLVSGSTDLLSAVLGALRIGIIPVMHDPALTPHERTVVLEDAAPMLIVDSTEQLSSLFLGPAVALSSAPLGRPMHYTSGTSGKRKGVWSGVLSEDDALALVAEEREQWGFELTDLHLASSPLHHSAPLRFACSTLLAGGSVAVLPKFDAADWAAAVSTLTPTTLFLAPAHLQRVVEALGTGLELPDLSSVRLLAYAGAPCPRPLQEWTHSVFPPGAVWEFYGSTEGQFTACSPQDWRTHPGSVGRARARRDLAVDSDGTIWCRVPTYARFEYWRDTAKTSEAWRDDWFTVGDLGRMDDDGYLYLDGRRDDLILSGGVNVYPREVEIVLEQLPGVDDVAVVARPDEHWGERVAAVVVGAATEDQLRAWAASELSPPRRPKDYIFVPSIPRNATGKVRRRFLLSDLGIEP